MCHTSHLFFNLYVSGSSAPVNLCCYIVHSLDFVGHVVLVVSPSLHQENQAEKEEEDEAHHWAHCGTNNHSHISG